MFAFAYASAAFAATPAKYLVFTVDRTGTIVLEHSTTVVLDDVPVSDALPLSAVAGARLDGIDDLPRGAERVFCDVVDASGGVVFRKNVVVQRDVRAEWSDPQTGEMRSQSAELAKASFAIRIPASANALVVTHQPTRHSVSFDVREPHRGPVPLSVRPTSAPTNSANRLDILIVAEGYTSGQSAKFQSDANALITQFTTLSPYSEYANYINFAQLFVASAQSGADHPPCGGDPNRTADPLEGTFANTAFDATYCVQGIQRLLSVDYTKVLTAAAATPNWDKIFVLVNDTLYGGSGGSILVGSLNASSANIIQHEFGHSFSGLTDEYSFAYPGYPSCSDISGPPCEPNATDQTSRTLIKWRSWISASTAIPTSDSDTTDIGLFTGARYESFGFYRPKHNCLMNNLGVPFCEICKQSFILRLYSGWTTSGGSTGSPAAGIDMIEPGGESPATGSAVNASVGTPVSFSITTLQPAGGPAAFIQWSVDNAAVTGANAATFQYNPTSGTHTVSVSVSDTTTAVNPAMAGTSLVHSRTWNVSVSSSQPPANFIATATSSNVALSWSAVTNASSYQIQRKLNAGAYAPLTTVSTTSYTDSSVAAGNAYLYQVRAVVSGIPTPYSNVDLATVFTATDDPIAARVTIKSVHLTELRTAINLARAAAGLAAATYSRSITSGETVLANDMIEMRTAIAAARSTLGMSPFTFTDSPLTPRSTQIKRLHVAELRTAIR